MKPFVIDSDAQIGIGETWGSPPRWVDYKVEALLGRSAEAGIDRSCVMAPRVEIFSVKLLKLPNQQEALVLGGNIQRLLGQ